MNSGHRIVKAYSATRVAASRDLCTVNMWAKQSCPKYSSLGLQRRRFRKLYRNAAMAYFYTPEHQALVAEYKSGNHMINTYPWPYCEPEFANWEENDSKEGYSLISDQSNCVVKYSTSYVAYKIFEETGSWPQKTSSKRLDAKCWAQFLIEAGYTEIVDHLEEGHHYVGIKPDEGEWGLVVWFEGKLKTCIRTTDECVVVDLRREADISTYYNKRWLYKTIDPDQFTWIMIN